EALEKPPRHAILRADHCRVRAKHRLQLWRQLWQPMCLHTQKNHTHEAYLFKRPSHSWPRLKLPFHAFHTNAVFLHRAQMWPTGVDAHTQPALGPAFPHIGSHGPGPRDQKFHLLASSSAAATSLRRIFPVAVCGISFGKISLLGPSNT